MKNSTFINLFKNKRNVNEFILFFFLSVVLSLFSAVTSPLITGYAWGFDAGVFSVMAQAWIGGVVPYKELFDHKGPLLYLFYMFDHILPVPKWGLTIISSIMTSFSCMIVGKMAIEYGISSHVKRIAIQLCFLLWIIYYQADGFLTESWSLLFLMIPMLFAIRFFRRGMSDDILTAGNCITLGFCFGIHAMLRLSNAALVAGVVLIILVKLVKFIKLKRLSVSLCYMGLGVLCVIAPFVVYFISQDSLQDAYYANLTFNMAYVDWHAQWISKKQILKSIFSMAHLGQVVLFIFSLLIALKFCFIKFKTEFIPLLFLVALNAYFLWLGDKHYFLVMGPFIALVLIYVVGVLIKKSQSIVYRTCAILFLICYMVIPVKSLLISVLTLRNNIVAHQVAHNEYRRLVECIPPNERKEVWSIQGYTPTIFATMDLIPANKFFYISKAMPFICENIYKDRLQIFRINPPTWAIVANSPYMQTDDQVCFFKEFKVQYELTHSVYGIGLYKLKQK